jgi:hypothetical protein
MTTGKAITVLELRNYLIKNGQRDRFIDYFEKHFTGSQDLLGGYVLEQFRIKEAPNRFFWIRGFSDMHTRSAFLPAFYGGDHWAEFGPAANDMMLEWHQVHLLRPLKPTSSDDFAIPKGLLLIDFYTAKDGQLDALLDFLQTAYLPLLRSAGIEEPSLWVSEMGTNDFPKLPVIQQQNLLVAITAFASEEEYREKLAQVHFDSFGSKSQLPGLLQSKETLVLYPTKQEWTSPIMK